MTNPNRIISLLPNKLDNKTKAIWCWQVERVSDDPDNVISFCLEHHINLFLIPYSNTITQTQWQYFIGKCSTNGIEVHALYGDPLWGLTAYQSQAITKIDDVNNYNQLVSTNQKFKGIHFDVESYLLDEWTTDRTNLIRQWVDSMQIYTNRTKSYGMKFAGAFPFWLDTSPEVNGSLPAEYTKSLHEIFIDMVDEYAIMSYRDTAIGIDSIKSVSETEVLYSTSPKIIVSVELTKQTPSFITYYEEGVLEAETAIKSVHDYYKSNVGYLGIAIHDFKIYELKRQGVIPKSPTRVLSPSRVLANN